MSQCGLFATPTLVATIPVFVTSGITVYLGIDLLRDWLIATRSRYSRAEWSIVLVIVAVIAVAGFAAALVVGLLIGVVRFMVSYAQIRVVHAMHTLERLRSTLQRDPIQEAALREKARPLPYSSCRLHLLRHGGAAARAAQGAAGRPRPPQASTADP